jgi:hypothetical protein
MKSGKRIAVLLHKNDRHHNLDRYSVVQLAKVWRDDGHEVTFLFGPKTFVPADLALVHVNLSVVPDTYIELARRYPIALNAGITDIRKHTFSKGILHKGDDWDGPVFVKSDLNYGGYPERNLGRTWLTRNHRNMRRVRRLVDRLTGKTLPFADSSEYLLYDNISDVPREYLDRSDLVVEKFRPELENGLYHTRFYLFLGDRGAHRRLSSKHPVVNRATHVDAVPLEPDPGILALRKQLGLDYGKLDYLKVNGEIILLDVNKTIGAGRLADDEEARRNWRDLAEGLYSYFEGGEATA